ncbi:DUF4136 domain-containing protein [Allosphingosinicella sp.]|jgi:hypothetical protein|uniref:DUF4136 domain-containing protein n=1 Tax=Allosphingosinicella sp. TaxID=2823234 RepID=UPI002EF6F4EB
MKAAGFALFAVFSLAGCATDGERSSGGGGGAAVDLTRTHLGQQLARAQIAVEPVNAADANSPDFQALSDAVERQLVRHGYTIAENRAASEQIARIDVRQGSRAALTTGWPGLARGGREANLIATLLDVRIQRRSDGTVFWQGKAVTEARAGTPGAQRSAAVERLATALFRDFPGESGRTIRVR